MAVRYVDEARVELEEAALWYEARRAGLGDRYLAVVRATERLIEQVPGSGAIIAASRARGSLRRARVHGFPYALIYMTRARTIWILAVAHMRRRPGFWRDRRPS